MRFPRRTGSAGSVRWPASAQRPASFHNLHDVMASATASVFSRCAVCFQGVTLQPLTTRHINQTTSITNKRHCNNSDPDPLSTVPSSPSCPTTIYSRPAPLPFPFATFVRPRNLHLSYLHLYISTSTSLFRPLPPKQLSARHHDYLTIPLLLLPLCRVCLCCRTSILIPFHGLSLTSNQVVLGISAHLLHVHHTQHTGPLGREIYTTVISVVSVLLSLLWLLPFTASFMHYPADFLISFSWFAAFAVLVNWIHKIDCGSAFHWAGLNKSGQCNTWKAAEAFSFLSACFWLASALLVSSCPSLLLCSAAASSNNHCRVFGSTTSSRAIALPPLLRKF